MVTTNKPRAVIAAPSRVPYPHGLFSVVTLPSPNDSAWESFGVRWETTVPGLARVIFDGCATDEISGESRGNSCATDWRTADPFTVEQSAGGPAVGGAPTEAAARDLLIATEQAAVEKHVWLMLEQSANDIGDAPPETIVDSIALVEQTTAEDFGCEPVLHMTRAAAVRAASQNLIGVVGGQLRTALGSRVVAGAGYPGETAGNKVFGTPEIFMLRTDITTMTGEYDTRTNTASILAQRTYLIGWNGAQGTVEI